jgi:hypothetical protein
MLTPKDIADALPKHLKSAATQELANKVNGISSDPEIAQHIRDNFVSYTGVLTEGKFRTEDYLNAVTYVSYKLMGYTNQESYRRTFPQRYQDLVAKGHSEKDISAYVAAVHKGKLVNLIMEQTLVPAWVLNQDYYQKAINVQAELMMTANSEKVRCEAANSLLTHLKKPETKQVELSVSQKEPEGMKELNDMLTSMAEQQRQLIEQGVPTQAIAHQKLGAALSIPSHTTPHHSESADLIESTAKDVTPKPSLAEMGFDAKNPLTSFQPESANADN